ncbi:MAG: aldose 1-epimerase family protein, partial [Collinsella sp.]
MAGGSFARLRPTVASICGRAIPQCGPPGADLLPDLRRPARQRHDVCRASCKARSPRVCARAGVEAAEPSANELAMCLVSEDNAALLSDYPYPFKLVARYTLEGDAVRVSYEVTNEGTEDMPFFIGGHPGFRCPLDEGEAYTDYELRFEKDEAAELCTAVPSTG